MFGGLMSKQQHNINCINQILRLNIPQITAAVRNAIRKHNIFDGDHPTNADLLYIVFECLTSYLENLDLQHIIANEQRLLNEINQIGQILQIVNVGKCLQYVDYRFRISNVLTSKVSDKMVSLTLSGVYLEAEKAFQNLEKHLYAKRLDAITSVTQITNETPENALTNNQITFWFQNVLPLVFHETKDIQKSAIQAVEAALPFIRLSPHQEQPGWSDVEKRITTEYSDIVITLREKGDSLWYRMWSILVKLLNKKLLRGAAVINKFLSICENGYKSPNYTTRAETFLCWKVLLEVYSQDAKYLSAKRIKLLLIPFKPIAKTSEIAVNKFIVWWSLICKVDHQINQHYGTILVPFLWFCFGLTDQPILTRTDDLNNRQEIYPELTTKSITALINLLGPVDDVTSSLCKSSPIERIRQPLVLPDFLENVGRFLINSCGEATFLLKDIELVDAVPVCENLWSNMMSRMRENSDPTLTELIVQNLTILMEASQNDEPANKLVTHAALIVLSSPHLIPLNIGDDITFGILKRTAPILTSDTIQFHANALKEIIGNLFKLSTEANQFHEQFQQILTLLQSQIFLSNVRVSGVLWHQVATHISDNLTANVHENKELTYDFIEWAVKNAEVDQLTILLEAWTNLARLLLINEEDDSFWSRMSTILRARADVNDKIIFEFIASVFQLIKPTDPFPAKFKSVVEAIVKSTPTSRAAVLLSIVDEINKLSEQITGEHSNATYHSLNELVTTAETKFDSSLRGQTNLFDRFRKNFEKFTKSNKSMVKPSKSRDEDFVFVPSKWQFRPDNLTEHQKEKLKQKRVDIPALYNDMSQSQDSQSVSLKPWTPSKNQLKFQANPAESPAQVVECEAGNDELNTSDTIAKCTNGALDDTEPITPSLQSPAETMASTSLDNNTNVTMSNTVSKIDEEVRKRKRVQNELNKLQLSITNADQFTNQTRTRRMSVNLTKPEQRLRKRAYTIADKSCPAKRSKRATSTSAESENDTSEVIEASQTTPTTRRTRQKRGSLGKTLLPQDSKCENAVSDAEKPVKQEKPSESNPEENVLPNVSVDSRSIGEQSTQEGEDITIKQTEVVTELIENQEEKSCASQENHTSETVNEETADNCKSNTEILTEKSDEVAIPHDNLQLSPIENAQLEVSASAAEATSTSPVKTDSGEDSVASRMSFIITSPSTSKNCSKTTELLNSTVDISPIPHAKTTTNANETTEPKSPHQPSKTEAESRIENIDKDQIKRTDLDNLIKTPMDSPMLQVVKYIPPFNSSTPQSHKDPKRKFQPQGRGAHLLQLMNIRKVEEAKAKTALSVIEATATPPRSSGPSTSNLPSYDDIMATNKDLFRFTKALPSPQASPSNSIMKRNMTDFSALDDMESPSQKRKRVSFHDPPVSATKEFLRFTEELKDPYRTIMRSNPLNARKIFERNNRVESLYHINKLKSNDSTSTKPETSMKSLKFDVSDADDDEEFCPLPLLTFSHKDEVLQHVLNEYPMEDVLGKYFESGSTLNDASSKIFANRLTDLMKSNESKRKLVLADLAEQFPTEFLDVAFEENQTSTVIRRLPTMNMLNYVAEEAKTDADVKQQLTDKFTSLIAADTSSAQDEMTGDMYQLLLKIISRKMSDAQLIDVLDVIFEKRRTNS